MSQTELMKDQDKQPKCKLGRKHRRDARLHELEKQLEFAESRCGTLKQQLDYIKLLYGCNRVPVCGNINDDNDFNENGHGDCLDLNKLSYGDLPAWSVQNATHGGGEGGKCSAKQASSFTNTNRTTNSSKINSSKSSLLKKEYSSEQTPYWKPKPHLKISKVKKKKTVANKPKSKQKIQPKCNQTDPVVTIYKNKAAKMDSETGLEVTEKPPKSDSKTVIKKPKKSVDDLKPEMIPSNIKSLNLFNVKVTSKTILLKEESVQTEKIEITEKSPPTLETKSEEIVQNPDIEYETENKNYSQPTIASKSKQVDRNMWTNLNVRSIPFIAATSTAPSHNIGVNIQQVLSIIKKKQPANENNQNSLYTMLNSNSKSGMKVKSNEEILAPDPKNLEIVKSSMSYWQSKTEVSKENKNNEDLNDRVRQLKKVLVFLHEDFSNLSQKYKKLQKKLTKRNIDRNDAKGELADIEKSLEKKEEEINVIIGLYKEVLTLRDELKRVQDKYNFVSFGKNSVSDGVLHSNSAHCQMSTLLRKIQNFQEKLNQS